MFKPLIQTLGLAFIVFLFGCYAHYGSIFPCQMMIHQIVRAEPDSLNMTSAIWVYKHLNAAECTVGMYRMEYKGEHWRDVVRNFAGE